MRKAGEFDEHLARKFEEDWGIEMPGWEAESDDE